MIVANSTPLINFAAIGRLDILETLFGTLTIPAAVAYELLERGGQYPSAIGLRQAAFIVRRDIRNLMLRDALTVELDPGEAETIVLALESGSSLRLHARVLQEQGEGAV